jgi:hypothetical protein
MKRMFLMRGLLAVTLLIVMAGMAAAQDRVSIGVVSIDTRGLSLDNESMGNLVRIEMEKTGLYEVLDKYDISDIMKENGIDAKSTFGKTPLIKVGKMLGADKILTGSAEKFGDKIVVILRLIDIKAEEIEKANVMEYLNQESEIQTMIRLSLYDLFGLPKDQYLTDLLMNFEQPVSTPKTTVKLNGPRMGASFSMGKTALRLMDSNQNGGFNMYPVSSMFGYQFEFQYLSSGDFQALIETIIMVNGLESGSFVPSFTFMNGFRFNGKGWEIGLGPVFRLTKMANGYWDGNDNWVKSESVPVGSDYKLTTAIDSRGNTRISTGLIIAAGKTFRSGYLNMPVNLYFSPRKEGSIIGLTFGFNIAKKPRIKES